MSSGAKRNPAPVVSDIYQIETRITCVDRAIIRDYFHQHNLGEPVRPAWMKAIFPQSHKPLLPEELECRLSVPFPGHERILVGSDVLLVETATREIVDVMRNARTTGGPEGHAARERTRALTTIDLPGGACQDPAARWRHDERVAIL